MRKDRIMDRHDRGTTDNLEAHILNMTSHNAGGGGASVFRIVNDDNVFGPFDAGNDSISAGGHFNFAAISGAAVSITTGDDGIYIGRDSAANATSTHDSISLGPESGQYWTRVNDGIALGRRAARGDIGGCTGFNFVAMLPNTLRSLTSGHDLLIFGNGAGADITNATHILLMGNGAGPNIVGSDHVNGFGNNVLFSMISGKHANVMGALGFWRSTTGDHLNGIGNNVGAKCTGNSSNILCLGNDAGPSTLGEYHQEFYIDNHATDAPLIHGDTDDHIVTINGTLVVSGGITEGGTGDFVRRDGTTPLTANWDAGNFIIRAKQFNSDIAAGSPPYLALSTTVCTNVNADLVDGYHHDQSLLLADSPSFAGFTKIGGATHYTTIEADGTIEFNGDATVWDDLRVPGTSVQKGASAPDLVAFLGAGNLLVNAFNGNATVEQVYFTIQLPHSYKEGSDITPHVHWTPTDANAGDVKWQLEYSWANIDATFPAVTTIIATDSTDTTAWKHHFVDFSVISGTGKTISSMLICRLFRDPTDGADTYGSDATFLEFDVHFEIDTVGSRQIMTK